MKAIKNLFKSKKVSEPSFIEGLNNAYYRLCAVNISYQELIVKNNELLNKCNIKLS